MLHSLLVIDDSKLQREHTADLCRALGVVIVHEAASGTEAIERFDSLSPRPELIVVDLEMPGMDGIETIYQFMRQQYIVPLIVASARESALIQAVEGAARNLGFHVLGAIKKPVNSDSLQAAFAQIKQRGHATRVDGRDAVHSEIAAEQLNRAIADQQIHVHYQPKVDMRTGIVRGVEALARWSEPELGPIRPDRFIALAEREGLIYPLTLAVMSQALAQAAEWNARGLRLSMAINLSPGLFADAALVDHVCQMLTLAGLQPSQIVLEITESSVLASLGVGLGALARFRLKGFGLSIDDYGTGFASMQRLARGPFTEIKLDRTFVNGAHRNENLRVILQSALDMGRRLELTTVAEGIETLEDWRLLQNYGCSMGQGYFIARPMPGNEIPQWLKRHQRTLRTLRSDGNGSST